ncbi:MAG TPA: DUF5916 domain-containing protein [Candidatus Aquilonibacter sp.]|nr:DUF5916 domain-containing protein [Candidatus Aquilonibacter sp.]
MKPALIATYTALVLACFTPRASAAVPPTFSFPMAKAPHPLALDPSLADPAWQAGKVPSVGGWENVTTRNPAPATTVYVLYDPHYLYVGFVVPQPGPLTATQTTNDVGFGTDDYVGVGIDPSGAGSQGYFFETTPRGVRYQQSLENVRFRPEWQTATAAEPGGWRAVMRIPLDDMRLHNGSQTWRITFVRGVAARGEHLSWSYDPLMGDQGGGNWPSFNDLRFWPSATSIAIAGSAAKPKPRLELFALGSAGEDRDVYQQANGQFIQEKTRPLGLDFTYPLASTINLVGTLNPDFSNVETDQQTIAPQEFARQLTEYRPFFAQGAQYINPNPSGYSNFNAPQNIVFYSPSVGPFDRGAKIEGSRGLQSFGVLSFRGYDEMTNDTFDDQAFGYKHALQDQTFQYWADGVIANHSESPALTGPVHDQTFEYGAKTRNLHTGLVLSFNQDIETGNWNPLGSAHSTNGFADVHQHNWEINAGYADISPLYGPIDGYTSNSDIRGPQGFLAFNGATRTLKNWSVFMYGDRFVDRSGAVHESDAGAFLQMSFKNGFSINGMGPTVSTLRGYDGNFYSGYLNGYQHGVNVPFNLFGLPIGYRDGTPTPIDVSANWGNFDGAWTHLYTASTSRPLGSRFTLGLEYDGTYQRDNVTGALNSQFLRRVGLGYNISPRSNLSIGLRGINGTGGFANPGVNLSAAYHVQLRSGDLYVNYGSPSSIATLNRLIVKYVFRAGADAGT